MVYNNKINIPINITPDINNSINYSNIYEGNMINNNPSFFIFLLDQSGSMSGKPMNLAIESLIFCLQSLPKNSYYLLIGFGSSFHYIYSKKPVEYTSENVKESISVLKRLNADLGGTSLFEPLNHIFEDRKYGYINLCRNLFILTDGDVEDKYKCLDLIEQNSNRFRVHTFGLGNYFDKDFIKRAGKKGSYSFISDISNLKINIIQNLNKTLRSYLYDAKIIVNDLKKEYEYNPNEKVYYQNESFNYYFIIKDKIYENLKIDFVYYEKNKLVKQKFIY